MRRVLVLLLSLGVLVSGCTGPADDPLKEDSGDDKSETHGGGPTGGGEQAGTEDPTNGTGEGSHLFDLRALEYQATLKRFELVAKSDLELTTGWDIAIGEWTHEEDCAALAVQIPTEDGEDTSNRSLSIVAWAWRNNFAYNEITLAGERHVVGLDLTQGESGGFPLEENGVIESKVPKGERVIVEIGGLTGALADGRHTPMDTPSQMQDNVFTANLSYTGDAELRELQDAPLRCGVSPHQAEGSLVGVHGFPQVVVDGSISMQTGNSSTFLSFHGPSFFTDQQAYRARFLDEVHENPRTLARSTDQGGTMSLEFDHWVETFPTNPVWFMADTHWPWIQDAFDQEG